jgi:hypothetical protein
MNGLEGTKDLLKYGRFKRNLKKLQSVKIMKVKTNIKAGRRGRGKDDPANHG